jgi:hypothetical protein
MRRAALFGGVVSLDLINGFATNRTKPKHEPTNGRILLCDQHRSRGGLHPLKVLKVFFNFFLGGHSVSTAARLLCDLLRAGAAQALSDQAQFALKKVDRLAQAAIVADAVFAERGIDLLGQPQCIVALIFDAGVRVPTWG